MSESMNDSLPNLSELPESSRAKAWERYQILRPHLEDAVPLSRMIAGYYISFDPRQVFTVTNLLTQDTASIGFVRYLDNP